MRTPPVQPFAPPQQRVWGPTPPGERLALLPSAATPVPTPPTPAERAHELRGALISNLSTWLSLATGGLALLRLMLDGPQSPLPWVLLAAAFIFLLIRSTAELGATSPSVTGAIPLTAVVTITAMALGEGGMASEALYWLPFCPSVGILIGASRRGGMLTALSLLSVASVAMAHLLGLPQAVPEWSLTQLATHVGALGMAILFGAKLGRSLRREDEASREALWARAAAHPISGLPGRGPLEHELDKALARAQRSLASVGLLYIDLDGFRRINDTEGHAAGDQMIRQAALQIQRGLRTVDSLFHIGGDEFVALLEACPSGIEAAGVAERVQAQLNRVSRRTGRLTASIGVAVSLPRDAGLALIARADESMYRAKRAGGACVGPPK